MTDADSPADESVDDRPGDGRHSDDRPPTLDPELRAVVADIEALGVPPWHALSVESARRVEADLFANDADIPVGSTLEFAIDGPDGNDLPVRVYRPEETPAPTLVFFHGGGWCLGTLDSADDLARRLCRRVGAVVVSVDYRLAPEHPFPAAVDDALRAFRWTRDHDADLGGNGIVGVAGSSAGGNLAAAVALAAPPDAAPAVQTLLYPITDRDFSTDSYEANADGPLLTREDMRSFWRQYLRSPVDAANPHAAPLRARERDLAATAPAVVVTGGRDPLRDDGAAYASRLAEAGVGVDHLDYPSLCHGFLSLADEVAAADAAFDDLAAVTRDRLREAAATSGGADNADASAVTDASAGSSNADRADADNADGADARDTDGD